MQIDRETVQRWKREFTGDAGLCDVDLWVYFAQRAAEQEREACAALCEERYYGDTGELNHELAEAIRARTKGKS